MSLENDVFEVKKGRFKAIFYGKEKVGKTTCAISFPCPYVIDAEKRLDKEWHVNIITKNNGGGKQISNYDEIMAKIKELLSTPHRYKTLVIDSLTVLQNEMTVGLSWQDYKVVYEKLRNMITLLNRLDMNVIVICHKKDDRDKTTDTVIGHTFDGYKEFGYMMDAILEIEKRGKNYYAVPRGAVGVLADAEAFEFKYDKFVEIFGRDMFEADTVPEVLATPEQVAELEFLLDKHKVSDAVINAVLSKAKAANYSEMAADKIQAWIDSLNKKTPKAALASYRDSVDNSDNLDDSITADNQ